MSITAFEEGRPGQQRSASADASRYERSWAGAGIDKWPVDRSFGTFEPTTAALFKRHHTQPLDLSVKKNWLGKAPAGRSGLVSARF